MSPLTTPRRGGRLLVCSVNYAPEILGTAPYTRDLAQWFAERGWDVVAIDYSPAAIEAAQAALGACAVTVRLADFFADDFGATFTVIYERAFLCALPPRMGEAYRDRVHALLADDGVLAGYFFVAPETGRGPPFAISDANLRRLLGSHFELIEDRPSPDRRTVFGDSQRWQVWQKHQVCGL